MVKGLWGKLYEWLRSLGLFFLEETEDRPHCYNFLMRGIDLSSVVISDKTPVYSSSNS